MSRVHSSLKRVLIFGAIGLMVQTLIAWAGMLGDNSTVRARAVFRQVAGSWEEEGPSSLSLGKIEAISEETRRRFRQPDYYGLPWCYVEQFGNAISSVTVVYNLPHHSMGHRLFVEVRSGWPFRGLSMQLDESRAEPQMWRGALPVPNSLVPTDYSGLDEGRIGGLYGQVHFFALPLTPRVGPLLLNTMFYALLAFATGRLCHRLIKARRRSRSQCQSCGYNIQGLTRCPECGTALAATS